MKAISSRDFFWFAVRCFIGAVYVYAGLTKLFEPVENFRAAILGYASISDPWLGLAAHLIPWIEVIAGFFLIVGLFTRASALVIALFSVLFSILMTAYFLRTGDFPADCGCFGEGSIIHLAGWQVLGLDLVQAFLCLRLFQNRDHLLSLDRLWSQPEKKSEA